jgi:hypothetical protein
MSRKLVLLLTLTALLSLFATPAAFASAELGSSCPPGFTREMVDHHDEHEHHHMHVGTSVNLNGDEFICVKPVTPDGTIHVHVDNILP